MFMTLGLLCSNVRAQPSAVDPIEVIVAAPPPPPSGAHTTLLAHEAAQTAGSQGDAAKAVQSLPGVARASGEGEPVVWGSSPHETGLFLDRVALPMLFHGSGLRSIVPTSLLSTVRLTPGAYGVEFGRYTGGVLELKTLDDVPVSATLVAAADALDASASLAAPTSPSSGARLGARYGYVDRWLPEVLGEDVAQLYTVPSYWDAHAIIHLDLESGDRAKIVLLTAHDRAQRGNAWAQYAERNATTRLYGTYEHVSVSSSGFTSRTVVTPSIGYDRTTDATSNYDTESSARLSSTSLGLRVETTLNWGRGPVQSAERKLDATALQRLEPTSFQLNAGLDARAETTHARHRGSLTVPPREGDAQVFGLPPGRDYVADDIGVERAAVAPYAELDLVWASVRITSGLRFETMLTELGRVLPSITNLPDTGASRYASAWLPRLGVEFAASRRVTWFGALSRHVQPPEPRDLGTLVGNPTLHPSEATHLTIGDTTKLSRTLSVQVLGFRKWLTHLATRSQAPNPQPGRLLADGGRGDVWGSQLFVQLRPTSGFSGWLGVTISQSRRRAYDGTWRRFDYDQPLSGTLVVNQSFGAWSLGSRLRVASGFPRPAVTTTYYDLQLGRYVPMISATAWWRLPAFVAFDVRAERRFALGAGGSAHVYVEVLNATNHENAEEVAYSSDYGARTLLRGLPLLAFVGVRTEL